MKKVAVVGIQGVPAQYGGFESLMENIIGENCSPDIEYTIFCSSVDMPDKRDCYKGSKLKYIPLHANGMSSVLYDIISMLHALRGYDTMLVLGISGCIFLPVFKILSRCNIIVNIDGLEYKRRKWGKLAKCFLKLSEVSAVKTADTVITDNPGIWDYVKRAYHKETALITYGGDNVLRNLSVECQQAILSKYNLKSDQYAISICRIEPENNSHIILEAFAETKKQLVFIGNWDRCKYSRELKEKYNDRDNILMIDSVYDLDELFALRNHCNMYIHGHSAGGTNPSLVEAMFFGKPILAYDVIYNRETTGGEAYYFKDTDELKKLIELDEQLKSEKGKAMKDMAQSQYLWKEITMRYEELY